MRARRLGLAIVLSACACGLVAAAASAKGVRGTVFVDRPDGCAITIPSSWQLVPRTKAAVEAEIATLKKKDTSEASLLASTYASIIANSAGLKGLAAYRLQAFAWPPDGGTPLLTEVSLGVVGDSASFGRASVTVLGDEYANALASNSGAKVLDPRELSLPAGKAVFIEATIPVGDGLENGVELYLIPHGLHVYELSFSIDARGLKQATLFTSIAEHFAFV